MLAGEMTESRATSGTDEKEEEGDYSITERGRVIERRKMVFQLIESEKNGKNSGLLALIGKRD